MPPLFVSHFESKVKKGCLLKYLICLFPQCYICGGQYILMAFQKSDSIAGHVLWEINSVCDSTKPRDSKVIYIVSG